jgi:ribonuclease inhibitor
MKRAVLDASHATLGSVYAALARALGFPGHFGQNLDALWDVLRSDIAGPFEIVWRDHRTARQRLGHDYDRLIAVLRDLEAERPDFTLRLE